MNHVEKALKAAAATQTRAKLRLRQAIDRACIATGEAQWTNGFRTGRRSEGARLYEKETREWERVNTAQAAVKRAMAAYASALRKSR